MFFDKIKKIFGKNTKNVYLPDKTKETKSDCSINELCDSINFSNSVLLPVNSVPSRASTTISTSVQNSIFNNLQGSLPLIGGAAGGYYAGGGGGCGNGVSIGYGSYGYSSGPAALSLSSGSNHNNVHINGGFDLLKFNIHGTPITFGENFKSDGDYYVINNKMELNKNLFFHFKVWKECNPEIQDFGMTIVPNVGVLLVFNSQQSKNQYLSWMEEYKNKFFDGYDMEDISIPILKEGNLNGIFLTDVFSFMQDEKFLDYSFDIWVKIVKNCSNSVYKMGEGWYFTNPTDGILCKML